MIKWKKSPISRYIYTPSDGEDVLSFIRNTPNALDYLESPSEELKIKSIEASKYGIEHIQNPTEYMIQLHNMLWKI